MSIRHYLRRWTSITLAICLMVELFLIPAVQAEPLQQPAPPDTYMADVMSRELARIGDKTKEFLAELEKMADAGLNPELAEMLKNPDMKMASADVTAEFHRFLKEHNPDLADRFFSKAPDMLGIEVDIVFQIARSDELKNAEGLKEKLKEAILMFRGDPARLRQLFLDNQFRDLLKLSQTPVFHDLAKDNLVGAAIGVGLDAGLNLLLGKKIDPLELGARVALDFSRSMISDAVKRTVTKALLARVATQNKVLFTIIGRFGMVSGTFISGILGMAGGELLDWMFKGDATGLKRLARNPELLLERGAMCVAGQLAGEAGSWIFAAVGSAFGPVGTVIGKALGYVIGYAIGYYVVGRFIEKRKENSARKFIEKARYFRARKEKLTGLETAVKKNIFTAGHALEEASKEYDKMTKVLGGHPAESVLYSCGVNDSDEVREARGKLLELAEKSGIEVHLLVGAAKYEAERDEAAAFIRGYEQSYEDQLDRDLNRFDGDDWSKASGTSDSFIEDLEKLKNSPFYDSLRKKLEGTDLIDPELNLWSYDRHSGRVVKLGPAFIGDVKETVFVTRKPSDNGGFFQQISSWLGTTAGSSQRVPRMRDYLSRYYVMIDSDYFPWHYNPLVDDWAPRYALPMDAIEGVLGLDPEAGVGEYGQVSGEALPILTEIRRLNQQARKDKIDIARDLEAMAVSLDHVSERAPGITPQLKELKKEIRMTSFYGASMSYRVLLEHIGDNKAWNNLKEQTNKVRGMQAWLFDLLYSFVKPDSAALKNEFPGWMQEPGTGEEAARAQADNILKLSHYIDFAHLLSQGKYSSVNELLAALDKTPSGSFFRNALEEALQKQFSAISLNPGGGFFGNIIGTIQAAVNGNRAGRTIEKTAVKPERLARYLMLDSLYQDVYNKPYQLQTDNAREKDFLPVFNERVTECQNLLQPGSGKTNSTEATGLNELNNRLKREVK